MGTFRKFLERGAETFSDQYKTQTTCDMAVIDTNQWVSMKKVWLFNVTLLFNVAWRYDCLRKLEDHHNHLESLLEITVISLHGFSHDARLYLPVLCCLFILYMYTVYTSYIHCHTVHLCTHYTALWFHQSKYFTWLMVSKELASFGVKK